MIEQFKKMIGSEAKDCSPSPLGKWLNGKLIAAEEGSLSVEFEVRPEMTNPAGIMHGGIAAAMMDEVIGMTTFSLGRKEFYAAANLNVDFLRPGKLGDKVIVQARVIRPGNSLIHLECTVLSSDGKLLSKATSNMIKTNF